MSVLIHVYAIARAETDTETDTPCISSQHCVHTYDYSTWSVDPSVWHDKTSETEKEVSIKVAKVSV